MSFNGGLGVFTEMLSTQCPDSSCRARQYSMGYELQVRSFRGLRDPCGTFYPQNGLARVRDTQHGARFLAIQDQVRLLEQPTNIRTRVVAGHGMIGVAK